jgi:hypothetical protein
MSLSFTKCKRRFDVTAKITSGNRILMERTTVVWAGSPSLFHLTEALCSELQVSKNSVDVSILYVREHAFEDYSPAQMGKMMAQEGYGFSDNPYANNGDDQALADLWAAAFEKETKFLRGRP